MAAPKSGTTAKKRPAERLGHRTKAEQDKTEVLPEISEEELEARKAAVLSSGSLEANPSWHPVAAYAWKAFNDSPLSRYYELTDYAQAWVTCDLIHQTLMAGTAGLWMQLRMYLNDLGFTEGARRTLDMVIEKGSVEEDPKKVIAKERLEARRAARGA